VFKRRRRRSNALRVGGKFVFIVSMKQPRALSLSLSLSFFHATRRLSVFPWLGEAPTSPPPPPPLYSRYLFPAGDELTRNEVNRLVRGEIRDNDLPIKVIC